MNPSPLRSYQQEAKNWIDEIFADGGTRTTYQAPPGAGKTHVAAEIIAGAGSTVFFVPTIALASQTIRRLSAALPGRQILAVSGDGGLEDDLPTVEFADGSGPRVTTDPELLTAQLRTAPEDSIVVSTYISSHVVATATAGLSRTWDLVVCDEAHHTAGFAGRAWSLPVDDETLPARRRVFMTATTRTVTAPDPVEPGEIQLQVSSMDDVGTYGPHISTLTWRQAITGGVLSDYEIAIIGVSDRAVLDLIGEAAAEGLDIDPEAAASQLALLRARDTHSHLRSVLAFHGRVSASKQWCEQLGALARVDDRAEELALHHIDGTTPRLVRQEALDALANYGDGMTVVSNCRVFGEGIDVPALDAVLFAAPRTSTNDLVQIVGRAVRPHPDHPHQKALIILPVVDDDTSSDPSSLESKLARSTHRTAWELLATLSEVDDQVTQAVNARLFTGTERERPADVSGVLSVDTSMLAVGASLPFELRTLSPVTNHHPVTAAHLRQYAALTGDANPKREVRTEDGYPLGARVSQARAAYREKRLARSLAGMYESVPGFRWYPAGSPVRKTDARFVELMELFVEQSGIHAIHQGQRITDPVTGQSVPIGRKANDWKWRRGLPEELRARVEVCAPHRRSLHWEKR